MPTWNDIVNAFIVLGLPTIGILFICFMVLFLPTILSSYIFKDKNHHDGDGYGTMI